MSQNVIEGIQQGGRMLLFLLIGWVLSGTLINNAVVWASGTFLTSSEQMQVAGAITVVLGAIDKWLAQKNTSIFPVTGARGLTGF